MPVLSRRTWGNFWFAAVGRCVVSDFQLRGRLRFTSPSRVQQVARNMSASPPPEQNAFLTTDVPLVLTPAVVGYLEGLLGSQRRH